MYFKKPTFDVAVTLRIDDPMAAAVEAYRVAQPIPPNVTAVYRYLLQLGLQAATQAKNKPEADAL